MPDTLSLVSQGHLLSGMLLTPLVGALVVWLVPGERLSRWVQPSSLLIALGFSLFVFWRFNPAEAGFQFVEKTTWIPSLNAHYLIGVDGISVLFPPLTLLLFLGTNLASWKGVRNLRRLHDSLMLMLTSALLGIFCALDLIFFFLCWEMTLIPIYFLISLWGPGPHRRYAAVNYSLFMLAGGVPLLFGFILLAFNHAEVTGVGVPAGLSWDYRELLTTPLAQGLETSVFLLLLVGFAVKTPVFPQGGGLRPDSVRLAPGAQRGPGIPLAIGRSGNGRPPVWGPGGHGPDQPASSAGLCLPEPCRSGAVGNRLPERVRDPGGFVPTPQLHPGCGRSLSAVPGLGSVARFAPPGE